MTCIAIFQFGKLEYESLGLSSETYDKVLKSHPSVVDRSISYFCHLSTHEISSLMSCSRLFRQCIQRRILKSGFIIHNICTFSLRRWDYLFSSTEEDEIRCRGRLKFEEQNLHLMHTGTTSLGRGSLLF